jgi:hypothetical protein
MSSHECSPVPPSYHAQQIASSIGAGPSSAQPNTSSDDSPGVLTPVSSNSHDVDGQRKTSSDDSSIIPTPDSSASMPSDSPETDIPLPNRKRKRGRAPFRTTEERVATAWTRKLGACISCRLRRVRVSDLALSAPRLFIDVMNSAVIMAMIQEGGVSPVLDHPETQAPYFLVYDTKCLTSRCIRRGNIHNLFGAKDGRKCIL